jgi:hypothetical protein
VLNANIHHQEEMSIDLQLDKSQKARLNQIMQQEKKKFLPKTVQDGFI